MGRKNKRAAYSDTLFNDINNPLVIEGKAETLFADSSTKESTASPQKKYFWSEWGVGGRVAAVAVGLLLAVGALGAGLKYLEESPKQQKLNQSNASGRQNDGYSLSGLNPFLAPPTPTPTPRLSKEYIYAGSRMLAVEDAGANAAPPADLAVWRVAKDGTATWNVMGGQNSAQTFYAWGGSGDKPVPGDYDGDGKTDFSIFRPSTGVWHIVYSSTGTGASITFGQSGDVPAPADYDGDGKTDAAVYRAASASSVATWYILKSSTATLVTQAFGLGSDYVAPADYDGDGRADIAIWRGAGYTFYVIRSSDSTVTSQTISGSNPADVPVAGDYDGDGKADMALVSTSSVWLIRQSSDSTQYTLTWGAGGDQPVPNDYDGDGRVDIAVWRTGNGNWYIRQSASNNALRQEAWGQAGDTPVPAFYRR